MNLEIAGLCFTSEAGAASSHDVWLVVLSYVIAALGSFTSLDMAERLRHASGHAARIWHFGAAVVLGGSIWAMHFVGMLAYSTEVELAYEPGLTLASLAIAVGFVWLGLYLVRGRQPEFRRLAVAGTILGLGVAAMHYAGMAAIRLSGSVAYTPVLWTVSILIAIAAATAALWLALNVWAAWQRAIAALVMALAICGMHYTGIASTVIRLDALDLKAHGLSNGPLAVAVGAGTLALLFIALISSVADRRLSSALAREAETLRAKNAELQAVQMQLEATQREIIRRLCSAGEFRDDITGQHVARMGMLAHRLALAAGCDRAYADRLREAAPLHDIGKIGIPDGVLHKPGKLDPDEWAVMQTHAEIGAQILGGSNLPLLDLAAEIAATHHEKWDGTGYPRGLKGEEIPLSGRIVALADVFDALLSPRPYKEPWPMSRVVALIREQSGRHFDPHLVEIFLAELDSMITVRGALESV
ncbi:MHYT domain-containing protein [Indioceanicola profundi]|uniref:MHYT domain-containing protein n=1 Tax=Indioceanicola profundi TaxID=2220096 RepID=UPI000E6AB319|nr:MHYT domain-containing protein [Indioceanicola profundi]